MKVLVTGATGFLGRHLIPQLIAAGHDVQALVRPTSDTTFLKQNGVSLAVAPDISSKAEVAQACHGCDAVIHAAGQFRFWGKYDEFYQTNVAGTEAVLEGCTAAGVKKFVHVSTIAIAGRFPAGSLLDENHPPNPDENYQKTKYEGEQLALQYGRDHDLDVVIIRPGAFYGPWGRYAFNRLFFEEPLRGWRIRVAGGRHIQFPAFVPDVAQGIVLGLQQGNAGEIYNICGESMSHNACNDIVSDLAGIYRFRLPIAKFLVLALAWSWTKLSIVTGREPFYPFNLRLYVFQDWRVSTEKAQKELGFRPTPFEDGARATLAWYKESGILRVPWMKE